MSHDISVVRLPRIDLLERLPRRLRAALVGAHRWGSVETVAYNRGIWLRERVTLLPPGTSDSDRAALTAYRLWPVLGATAALLAMVPLGEILSPAPAFGLTFGGYALGVWLAARATRRVRRESLSLVVITVCVGRGRRSYGNLSRMAEVRGALGDLDARLGRGELTPTQHEFACAAIYRRLDAERQAVHDELERAILASESDR